MSAPIEGREVMSAPIEGREVMSAPIEGREVMSAQGPADRGAQIRAYFESCNSGSPDQIAAHFTDQATIYDTNHPPVRTAVGIGRFWEKIRGQWQGAVWQVDRVVSDGDTAAIEWTMAGDGERGAFVFRGSEHYAFEGDLIAEIRQYWNFDRSALDTGLVDFPYDTAEGFRAEQSGGERVD